MINTNTCNSQLYAIMDVETDVGFQLAVVLPQFQE